MAESNSNETTQKTGLDARPRVLVVDDEPGVRQVIRVNLVMQGHDVVEAKNGAQALKAIEENGIDLVILDLMMPKVSGWDVLEEVRQRRGLRALPIIVLSAVTTEDAKVKAFDLGAVDYVVKPFAVGELLARVNRTLHERKEKQVLAEFSITDWVTGLFNRRYLELRLPQEVSRAHRYGTPLTALFFEIDQLPWLLEQRGPHFVDGILQEVATLVRGQTRACDVLFRYDGDFFIALLPDTPMEGGQEVGDRIRRKLLETEWHQGVGISGSFGVVELEEGEEAAHFIGRAEDALMQAKKLGGNALWPPKPSPTYAGMGSYPQSTTGTTASAAEESETMWEATEAGSTYSDSAGFGGVFDQYPVEEGAPGPLIQQEVEPITPHPNHTQWDELESSTTQRIDPSHLAQVRQQFGRGDEEGYSTDLSDAAATSIGGADYAEGYLPGHSEPYTHGEQNFPTEVQAQEWYHPEYPQQWPESQGNDSQEWVTRDETETLSGGYSHDSPYNESSPHGSYCPDLSEPEK